MRLGNTFDSFAISVMRDNDITDQPRVQINLSHLFIVQNYGSIQCTVTRTHRFSRDLTQVGLEIATKPADI